MNRLSHGAAVLLLLAALNLQSLVGHAQGTAFTYQGRLNSGGGPAGGSYDLQFTLYATNAAGTALAGPVTNSAVGVTNGLFATLVDFGPGVFVGASNWLQVAVGTNRANNFSLLAPRQQLTPVPYAITAATLSGPVAAAQLSGAVPATQISGMLTAGQLPAGVVTNGASGVTLTGVFAGDAAALTNLQLSAIGPAGLFSPWGFSSIIDYGVGRYPVAVAAADFNGDGKIDLVSQNADSYTLTVLTNSGGGIFGSNATLNVGTYSTHVITADVNGDGKPDIISLSINGPLIVFTNNGLGGFGAGVNYSPGSQPLRIAAVDIYHNGRPALVTALFGNSSLLVMTNDGSGTFGSNATLNVVGEPNDVTAADVNGDGALDLICANGNGLTIFTNNGFGVFGSNANLTVNAAMAVAAADVNGDGKVDLVCGSGGSSGTLTVFTNNGFGIFGSNATLQVGSYPETVVAADLTGDGNLDLVSANTGDGTLTVLINNGGGGFDPGITFNLGGMNDVVAVDANGDGATDLIAAVAAKNALAVMLNSRTINVSGAWSFASPLNNFAGNGSRLTGLNASQLTNGTVPLAQLPATLITNKETGVTLGGTFTGDGSGLTNLNASQLVSGVVPTSVLPGFVGSQNSVGGGSGNIASASYATLAGGQDNSASSSWASIGGGLSNKITSRVAATTIGGGAYNIGAGNYAVVPGGYSNLASGAFSFAAGQQAQATNQGTFVWADSQNAAFASTSSNQFLVRAGGNVGINTTTPGSELTVVQANAGGRGAELSLVNPAASTVGNEVALNFGTDPSTYNADTPNAQIKARLVSSPSNASDLIFSTWNGFTFGERLRLQNGGNLGIANTNPAYLLVVSSATSPAYCNGTTWVNGSDRNAKQDFNQVNPGEVLAKVATLPITEWQYKAEPAGTKHIGPMAQDFHAAFGLNGGDDKHISTVDEGGVALAAIQGLNQNVEDRFEQLEAENAELKQTVAELKQLVQTLAEKK